MKNDTKRQHYLPKAYLSFFATKGHKAKRTYVYFKGDKVIKSVSIDDICAVNDLYEQKYTDSNGDLIYVDRNSIENSFIEIEGKYSAVINKLDCAQLKTNEGLISEEDRNIISMFMALTIFRSPVFVNVSNQLVEKHQECLKGCNETNIEFYKFAFLEFVLSMDEKAKYIPAMKSAIMDDYAFVLKASGCKFITSNRPIINLTGEYKGEGFDMVGLPISPNYFFAFVDSAKELNNRVISIDDEFVDFLNSYQVNSNTASILISKDGVSLSRYIGGPDDQL